MNLRLTFIYVAAKNRRDTTFLRRVTEFNSNLFGVFR